MNIQAIYSLIKRVLTSEIEDAWIPEGKIGENKEYKWRASSVNHEPILINNKSGKIVAGAGKAASTQSEDEPTYYKVDVIPEGKHKGKKGFKYYDDEGNTQYIPETPLNKKHIKAEYEKPPTPPSPPTAPKSEEKPVYYKVDVIPEGKHKGKKGFKYYDENGRAQYFPENALNRKHIKAEYETPSAMPTTPPSPSSSKPQSMTPSASNKMVRELLNLPHHERPKEYFEEQQRVRNDTTRLIDSMSQEQIERLKIMGQSMARNIIRGSFSAIMDGVTGAQSTTRLIYARVLAEQSGDETLLKLLDEADKVIQGTYDAVMEVGAKTYDEIEYVINAWNSSKPHIEKHMKGELSGCYIDDANFNIKPDKYKDLAFMARAANVFELEPSLIQRAQDVVNAYDSVVSGGAIGKGKALKGQPMSHKEADTGNTNPLYNVGWYDVEKIAKTDGLHSLNIAKHPYQINCQSCVVAYLARRMGYNVIASPNYKNDTTRGNELSHDENVGDVYLDEKGNPSKKWDFKNMENGHLSSSTDLGRSIIESAKNLTKDDAIFVLTWFWTNEWGFPSGGHIINVLKEKDQITFYDPQTNKSYTAENFYLLASHTGQDAPPRMADVKMMRVDNKTLNPYYVYGDKAVVRSVK